MARKAGDPAARFERMVDRTGEHHLWLGAVNPQRGTGRFKLGKAEMTAHRAAWEFAHGPIPFRSRVNCCPVEPTCVRLEHLSLDRQSDETRRAPRTRAPRGGGSKRRIRHGTWELRVTVGRWDDGRPRTIYRTVTVSSERDASAQLAAFVQEMRDARHPDERPSRNTTVDEAIERFLSEYLGVEKGRAEKTISDYRRLHYRWFSPTIGARPLARVDGATMDRLFGEMRRAGLSASRLNHAKSLYSPFFRWAKRRGLTSRDPMADFEMPISSYRPKERRPPEIEELVFFLSTAVAVVPDIAPLLVLGAVTGMRRGELVGIRRSAISWKRSSITVNAAVSEAGYLKGPKTGVQRRFYVDGETMQMLRDHCEQTDEVAERAGVPICADPFLFSLAIDCSRPLPPDHFTKRVAVLKGHLGIEEKGPEIIALEDEALRLWRSPASPRPAGRTGPAPKGGLPFRQIGEILGRSERWAALAVEAAGRREGARDAGHGELDFDGSIIALRRFTSSELLDAGFNISVVAHRQGHGPQVLTRHYSKSRESADRRAADHLGRIIHGESA